MDAVRQWAICLIAAAAAGTFAAAVIPGGSMEKTVKAVAGIFVVVAVCSPLAELRSHGLPTFADLVEQAETPAYAQAIDDGTLRFCEQAVSEALTAAAEETGVEVTEINAELSAASDGIIIHNVSVAVNAASADKIEEFSLSAERRLGFPVSITAE